VSLALRHEVGWASRGLHRGQSNSPSMVTAQLNQSDTPEFRAVFPPWRAGALAGVSGNRIGQWARNGLVHPNDFEGRPRTLYTFNDVAEAIVIRWLLDRSFTYEAIHGA